MPAPARFDRLGAGAAVRFRTWPVVAVALIGLLLVVVVSVVAIRTKAQAIYSQLDQLNDRHRQVEFRLRRLRGDVHASGIFVRDYLLDTSRENAAEYRVRLAELRQANMSTLSELTALVGPDEDARVVSLRTNLTDYWEGFEPLFGWTVAQKLAQSPAFLRREVIPRRNAVMAIAEEIESFNNDSLSRQRRAIAVNERELRRYVDVVLWISMLAGLIVAVTAGIRIRVLERRSEEQHERAAAAETSMRQLSHQLVKAQEAERKNLSRELHDHVGQMLTALRMELGTAERSRVTAGHQFGQAMTESKRLSETMLRTVRDLAMGLRPSMLDDFGLKPALEWLARDVARRWNLRIDLTVDGELEPLPDAHRTCIYRVVQEALTNCVRHARATRVTVAVVGQPTSLDLRVEDDGVGADLTAPRAGLGLIGLDERVRELGGRLEIESRPGEGTALRVTMPVPALVREEAVLEGLAG
jgi:signal transduction histidine kinase